MSGGKREKGGEKKTDLEILSSFLSESCRLVQYLLSIEELQASFVVLQLLL